MALNDSFANLVNDISQQVLQQVQQQVQGAVSLAVTQRVNELITEDLVKSAVDSKINAQIDTFQIDLTEFDNRIIEAGNKIINGINTESMEKINVLISSRINGIDLEALVKQYIESNLNSDGRHLRLLPKAIPGTAVDTETLKITGDQITGGTVTEFASTGIDDKATSCKLTIMDVGTIFENTLYAPRVEVKGDAVVDGNLIIKGVIPRESQTYQNIVADVGNIANDTYDRVFAKLQTETLDIAKLTVGHRSIIEGDTLTTAIVNSNLRRVGTLQDLQTSGESLLSETLYTSNKRVGINTMDPSMALSIWDEEIEVGIGKRSQGTAQVTTRANKMVVGINTQNNITLTADGNVIVPQIKIGNMQFSTSPSTPNFDAVKGTVVFNENPSIGGPLGWVSLGESRWANFGIID